MTLEELAALVRDMREVQREFFDPKRRKPDTCHRAVALERKVDAALAEVLGPARQGRMF